MDETLDYINITVSCASDPGKQETNRDCCGYRCGKETVISNYGTFTAYEKIEGNLPFLTAVADGKVLFDDPHSIEDRAQSKAISLILYSMYKDFFKDEDKQIAIDLLNQHILYHCKAEYPAVAVAALGIKDNMIHTMHTGSCAILRIHDSKVERLTPLKLSKVAETYLGTPDRPGHDMTVFAKYPLCEGDTWILASDGVMEPFTGLDYDLDDNKILWLLGLNTDNHAALLVRSAAETYYPVYERSYCTDSHTAVVIHIGNGENETDPVY